jgi:hypothetical protein
MRTLAIQVHGLPNGVQAVIAICIGLVIMSTATTGFIITMGVWLRADKRELGALVDNLDGQRKLVAEYKHRFDTEFVAHGVTTTRLVQEQDLRAVAEAQRNEAMRKARAYLARSMEGATKDDVNAVLADLFASPLSLVPRAETGRASGDGPDSLLDPFSAVPPA